MPRAVTIGEELAGAWLSICGGCEFVTYSQRHPTGQGENRHRRPVPEQPRIVRRQVVSGRAGAHQCDADEKDGIGPTVGAMAEYAPARRAEHVPQSQPAGEDEGQIRHNIAEIGDAEP